MCIDFNRGIRLNDLIHSAGEGVNSTTIHCNNEQSLTGMHISFVSFASNESPMYKSSTKTKKILRS